MQTEKKPYELLIRWDQFGALAGAHVQHRYVITDDGMVIGETLGGAEPLTLDTAPGFPLGDLLSQVQINALVGKAEAEAARDATIVERDSALAQRSVAEQALATANAELAGARDQIVTLQAGHAAALARVAALEAQLAALQSAAE